MDSLNDILLKRDFDEPSLVSAIKSFVRNRYKAEVGILLRDKNIIIVAPSAALISSLRLHQTQLKQFCPEDHKLLFQIRELPS